MTVTSMEVSSPNNVDKLASASNEDPKETYKKLDDPGRAETNMDNSENNGAIGGEARTHTEGGKFTISFSYIIQVCYGNLLKTAENSQIHLSI